MVYLIDANHFGDAAREDSPLGERIAEERRLGHQFGTVIPVRAEVQTGLLTAANPAAAERRWRALLRFVKVWPLEMEDVTAFAELSLDLRRRGRALSQIDRFIAVVAMRRKAVLLTTDRDFEAVPLVKTENWLD